MGQDSDQRLRTILPSVKSRQAFPFVGVFFTYLIVKNYSARGKKNLPFGETLSGAVPTDKQFTGQRLDATGLYYFNARYYDATIGRFISPDTIIPNFANPQDLNRYTYCSNNPLTNIDPSGHDDYMILFDYFRKRHEAEEQIKQLEEAMGVPELPSEWTEDLLGPTPDYILGILGNATNPNYVTEPVIVEENAVADVIILPGAIGLGGTLASILSNISVVAVVIAPLVFLGGCSNQAAIIHKEGKSQKAYDKHKKYVNANRKAVKQLEIDKGKATSPKERGRIQKLIDQTNGWIKGHEKEMKQKWPNGRPEE